jgi:hypothetical protein
MWAEGRWMIALQNLKAEKIEKLRKLKEDASANYQYY